MSLKIGWRIRIDSDFVFLDGKGIVHNLFARSRKKDVTNNYRGWNQKGQFRHTDFPGALRRFSSIGTFIQSFLQITTTLAARIFDVTLSAKFPGYIIPVCKEMNE
jgi:hypothetical protein